MNTQGLISSCVVLLSLTLCTQFCTANQTQDLRFLNSTGLWRYHDDDKIKLTTPLLVAGVFCFLAAAISSAGGIGGGGLFIPILTILAGLDLKTASTFSAFMVMGGSMANVLCNLMATRDKILIDFDIALLSEPCMLLGVSAGVICNVVFPEWLITILFAVFLAWSTFKTCKNGIWYWRLESEVVKDSCDERSKENKNLNETLLRVGVEDNSRFPWLKLGVLLLVWFSFSFLYLLRGNNYGEGIIRIKPCGLVYWILSAFQIPLAVIFTSWILFRKDQSCQSQAANHQDIEDSNEDAKQHGLIFPVMALLAGVLGGVFGIGGGMLINPLLLHVGVAPEVSAATCAFMVLFSSTMSAFQYLMLGMEHVDTALIYTVLCFFASLLGLLLIQRAIKRYGRASLIVFSVSIVMALSTILMTTFGALDVWKNYRSGKKMGFKLPC